MRGFQPSAFQRNAFQMDGGTSTPQLSDAVIGAAHRLWKDRRDREKRRRRAQDAQILARTYLR